MNIISEGSGRPIVLLHGWGMNSQIWAPIRQELRELGHIHYIDMPGHGLNHELAFQSLEHVTTFLEAHIPENAIVIGWSLGGLIAQNLAQRLPKRITGLILVGSTPKFVMDEQWVHGLSADVLAAFETNLQTDYVGTIKRFFALQFLGIKIDNKTVVQLRDGILALPADKQALADGLTVLATADFTRSPVTQPTQWILGRLDKLIPVSVADGLTSLGYSSVEVMHSAAHVPFVTHSEEFMQLVRAFLHAH